MKTLRSGLCLLLALVMLLLTATSCKKDQPDDNTAKYDSENDVVRFTAEGSRAFFSTPKKCATVSLRKRKSAHCLGWLFFMPW